MSNRVVITGYGTVSPFGLGVAPLFEAVWQGQSGVEFIPGWGEIKGLNSTIAAPVPPFDPKKFLPRSDRRTMGPMAIYATLAAKEAVKKAEGSDLESRK